MGKALGESEAEVREVYRAADDALGLALSELCWVGPEAELQLTANTQPALLATSIAIHRVLRRKAPPPSVVAGHSLGEYSALVAVGALPLPQALRLVRRRGELMQQAVPVGDGAMAAILGLASQEVSAIVSAAGGSQICAVANFNSPQQTVIAGHREAVERATALAKERGAKRCITLPVSAPFHSPLMRPAREAMQPLLEEAPLTDPEVPVITNVDAAPARDAGALRSALIDQIDNPVRWVESVERMVSEFGVERVIEVGPGKVLAGLVRRIAPGVEVLTVSEPEDLESLEVG